MFGTTEILVICGVVILLFGASSLPKLARSIGNAKGEFQKGLNEESELKEESIQKPKEKDLSQRTPTM